MVRQVVQVDAGQVGQPLVQFTQGLGGVGLVEALVELLVVQPAGREVLAQQRRGPVAIRVRGTDPGIVGHRALPPLQPAGCGCMAGARTMPAGTRTPAGGPVSAVSTHGPSGVMATVCSKCADQPPSSLTTVQPSSSSRVFGLPSTSSGSMARAMPSASTGPRPGRP